MKVIAFIAMKRPLELRQADELIRAQMARRLAEPLPKSGRGRAEDLDLGSARVPKASELFVDALEASSASERRPSFHGPGGRSQKRASPLSPSAAAPQN